MNDSSDVITCLNDFVATCNNTVSLQQPVVLALVCQPEARQPRSGIRYISGQKNQEQTLLKRKRPATAPCKAAVLAHPIDTVPLLAFCAEFTSRSQVHGYGTAQELAVRL